jgi:hypothetical protein
VAYFKELCRLQVIFKRDKNSLLSNSKMAGIAVLGAGLFAKEGM